MDPSKLWNFDQRQVCDKDSVTQARPGVSGTATSVKPKGSSLPDSVAIKSEAEIGDIKRASTLFDSLVRSNSKHVLWWIAAARFEEHARRMVAARKLTETNCGPRPKSEDVWLEAARLHVRGLLMSTTGFHLFPD